MMASGWVKKQYAVYSTHCCIHPMLELEYMIRSSMDSVQIFHSHTCSHHSTYSLQPFEPNRELEVETNESHNGFRRREGHRRQRNRADWMQYDHWIIAEENMLFFWAQGVNGFVGISKVRRLWGTCSGGRQHQLWGSKMQEAPLQEMSLFTEGGAEVVCGSGQDWGMGGNEFRGKTWGCSGKQG